VKALKKREKSKPRSGGEKGKLPYRGTLERNNKLRRAGQFEGNRGEGGGKAVFGKRVYFRQKGRKRYTIRRNNKNEGE